MKISKLLIVALLLSLQYCSARVVFGILEASNTLITFDSTSPATLISSIAIIGIPSGDNVVGIDIRPLNGQVYLLTTGAQLYTLNTITGVATSGSALINGCVTPNTSTYGMDFDPVTDTLRVISSSGSNYAVNVDDGSCTIANGVSGTGSSISITPTIVQIAFSFSFRGASSTVLYGIDSASTLGTFVNPTNGVFTQIGNGFGVNISSVGFDIVGGNSWASLTVGGISSLYAINLTTGSATAVGIIGGGSPLSAIAISFTDFDATFFGLNNEGHLFRFESEDASSLVITAITGLATNEFLLGFDFRPLNNVLYAISNNSRVFAINTLTSAATVVGTPLNCSFTGSFFGIDWNPTVDLLRVVTDSGANYRVNVNTSACFIDTAVSSTTTVVPPRISSIAYSNNFVGAPNTTLFAIDYSGSTLGNINPPGSGIYNFISNLSQPTGPATGFDIFGASNTPIAAIDQSNVPYFVTLDLTNGNVSFIASPGSVLVRSLSTSFSRLPYSLNGFYPEILVLTASQNLIRFTSNDTSNVISAIAVSGVEPNTNLLGMALRPSTSEIFAVGSDGKIYILYPPTTTAIWNSTLNCTLSANSTYSFDFNPVTDRLRIVSRSGENYRVDVTTGNCFIDGNLQYTSGGTPGAVGLAYSNSVGGATTTNEYILDALNSNLDQILDPNVGSTSSVGPTGLSISTQSPFDILANGAQQQGFAAINGNLYDININNGAARLYGTIVSDSAIVGLTALPQNYVSPTPPSAGTTSTTSSTATTGTTSTASTASTSTTESSTTTTTELATSGAASLFVSFVLLGTSTYVLL